MALFLVLLDHTHNTILSEYIRFGYFTCRWYKGHFQCRAAAVLFYKTENAVKICKFYSFRICYG